MCPRNGSSIIPDSILTLDDETEAEAAKGQVSKHRLFLWLANNVTFCVAAVKLESQRELSGLHILFDLKEKQINVKTDAAAHKQTDFLQEWILMPVQLLLEIWSTKCLDIFSFTQINFFSYMT